MKSQLHEPARKKGPDMEKNILITGVSRGLGLVIAETLLMDGYTVYAVNRSFSKELEELTRRFKGKLLFQPYDLEKSSGISEFFKNYISFSIPLHGFVNNAAMAYDDIITNLNLEQLEKMYRVNVFSPMLLTKLVIRHMLLHNVQGSIVHISSISAHTGYKGLGMYASTKGALEAFSKNTAREWGEKGIRSNCVVAGFMETSMNASLSMEQKDRIYARTSLKKATAPGSVSETVAFLLSEKAGSVTGQNLIVDNGTL
jgi:3-oxoacyl-[acyl-carrier protein] reductase